MELVIAVCGGDKVGKSSIIKSFCGDDYKPDQPVQYKCVGPNNLDHLVHIYIEKFRSSLSNPDGCIFVYDITSLDSFRDMCEKYQRFGGMFRQNVVFGNKSDQDSKRAVSQDEVNEWIQRKSLKHVVGNSHTKFTIDLVFYQVIQDILNVMDTQSADKFRSFVQGNQGP